MKAMNNETPDSADLANDNFLVGTPALISKTTNLFSAKIGIYILTIGLVQFLWGLTADLLFFSSSPFFRPFYFAAMGTDPFALLTSALNLIGFSSSSISWILIFYFIGEIIFAVFYGGAIKFTLDVYKNHSEGNVKKSLSFAKDRGKTLIAVQIVIGLLIFLIFLPIIVALILGIITLHPIRPYSYLSILSNYFPLLLICFSVVIYVLIRFTLAPVVIIAEDLNTKESLRRAWDLTRGNSTHVFKGIILLMILLGTLSGVLAFLALVLFFGVSIWMTIIPAAINQLLLSPIYSIFAVILYLNLLARRQFKNSNWWNKPTKGMDEKENRPSTDDTD